MKYWSHFLCSFRLSLFFRFISFLFCLVLLLFAWLKSIIPLIVMLFKELFGRRISLPSSVRLCLHTSVRPCLHASVGLCLHAPVRPYVRPSMPPCVRPSMSPCARPSMSPCVRPSMPPCMRPSVHFSMRPSVHFPMCPSIYVSMRPSVHDPMRASVHAPMRLSFHALKRPSMLPKARIFCMVQLDPELSLLFLVLMSTLAPFGSQNSSTWQSQKSKIVFDFFPSMDNSKFDKN